MSATHPRAGDRRRELDRFDYFFVERAVEPRWGRRTALTFPLFPPPQKN